MPKLYTLPMGFDKLIKKQHLPSCSLYDSVREHIILLLMTPSNTYRFDYEYGCSLWEQDFEILGNTWKNDAKQAIMKCVQTYEKRIGDDIRVDIDIQEETSVRDLGGDHLRHNKEFKLRKRLKVIVSGTLKETKEFFKIEENIYLSPGSLD